MIIQKTGIVTTFQCNLKCKHCAAYAPYYAAPKVFTLDYLKKSIDKFFELDLSVKKFTLSGGEPLLFPELDKLLDYVGTLYGDRIEILEVITNGTIPMSDGLFAALKKHSPLTEVMIDDYIASSVTADTAKRLEENGIRFRIRDYKNDLYKGGWVDMSDFSLKNSPEEATALFNKCTYGPNGETGQCYTSITNGKIYHCHFSRRADEVGAVLLKENEYLDLFDETETPKEKTHKLFILFNEKAPSACKHCLGLYSGREAREYPAQQLTPDEIKMIKTT
jgi:sulfatase maturation enzyme AslB (radical SAM superfamily)